MAFVDGVHAHDVGQVLDADGVAVRVATTARGRCTAGSRAATTRVTVAAYNTLDEIDTMLASLDRVPGMFVDLMDLYQELILEHQAAAPARAPASPSTPRCTTSTRPVVTR